MRPTLLKYKYWWPSKKILVEGCLELRAGGWSSRCVQTNICAVEVGVHQFVEEEQAWASRGTPQVLNPNLLEENQRTALYKVAKWVERGAWVTCG
jgi:hypothetical protein